jgi:hypothetical protein
MEEFYAFRSAPCIGATLLLASDLPQFPAQFAFLLDPPVVAVAGDLPPIDVAVPMDVEVDAGRPAHRPEEINNRLQVRRVVSLVQLEPQFVIR